VARYRARVTAVVRADLTHRTEAVMHKRARAGRLIGRLRAAADHHRVATDELCSRTLQLEEALPRLIATRGRPLEDLQRLVREGRYTAAERWLAEAMVSLPRHGEPKQRADSRLVLNATRRELTELATLRAHLGATEPQRLRLERHLARAEQIDQFLRRTAGLLPPLARPTRSFEAAAQRLAQELAPVIARGAASPLRWVSRLAARDDEASRGR